MDCTIICKSIHKGNTRKVAEQVGDVLNCQAVDSEELSPEDISSKDLIGVASGVYGGNVHKSILELLERTSFSGKPCFLVTTSGFPSVFFNDYEKKIRAELSKNGLEVFDSFTCRGHDEYGPLKYIGGMYKTRPNKKDLKKARQFAEKVEDRFRSI